MAVAFCLSPGVAGAFERGPDEPARPTVAKNDEPVDGDATPTFAPPEASVRLVIDGRAFTAGLPRERSADRWLDGPLAKEWRHVVAPVGPENAPHPFLRVVFDTRVFADGRYRVDSTVENVLDTAAATHVDYDLMFAVNGATVYEKGGVRHPRFCRLRLPVAGLRSFVRPNLDALTAAKAVQNYDRGVPSGHWTVKPDERRRLEPFGQYLSAYTAMGTAGGRQEIGPIPAYSARYLVHGTDGLRENTLGYGDHGGAWPVHVRKPDGSLVSIDAQPSYWLDSRGQAKGSGYEAPAGDLNRTGLLIPVGSHTSSFAHVPLLTTGERFYADEQAFWANYHLIGMWPTPRRKSEGLVYQQVRDLAWGIRNLSDAAAWLPDSHPNKAYFRAKAENNVALAARMMRDNPSPVYPYFPGQYGANYAEETTEYVGMPPWMYDYVAVACEGARRYGLRPEDADYVVRRHSEFRVRQIRDAGDLKPWYASYTWPVKKKVGTSEIPLESWQESLEAKRRIAGSTAPTFYYTNWMWPFFDYAIARGVPGADEAKAYAASKWPYENQLADSGWAIVPDGPAPKGLPTYEATGEWATVPVTLPEGKAKNVRAAGGTSQTDVMCRWPDGSVKFALVTVATAGNVQIEKAVDGPIDK